MAEKKQGLLFLILGGVMGAAAAIYFLQKNEPVRVEIGERLQPLREQAMTWESQWGKTPEEIAARQAAVSAEVEEKLRVGKASLQTLLQQARQEIGPLETKSRSAMATAQDQLQLARKKAEILALEARARILGKTTESNASAEATTAEEAGLAEAAAAEEAEAA